MPTIVKSIRPRNPVMLALDQLEGRVAPKKAEKAGGKPRSPPKPRGKAAKKAKPPRATGGKSRKGTP